MSAPAAWDTTRGDANLIVAVLDSGIDLTHSDLKDNLWVNLGETPSNGIDDDRNGYIDDVNGWNFYSRSKSVNDSNGHGTHCAGIIGAAGNNALGVSGISPLVRIMPLVVMDSSGFIATSDEIAALNYAVANHVLVTSNSYGGSLYSAMEKSAIDAAQAAGVLFVCAAGNSYPGVNIDKTTTYPASYPNSNIISVAASTSSDGRPASSNYGLVNVDLAAPGIGILSTLPGSQYGYDSGTSMACPLVAGACVLVKAAHPELGWLDIKNALLGSVDPVPAFKGLVKTGGRLNVARAVRIGALPSIEVTSSQIKEGKLLGAKGNGDGVVNAGEDATVAVTIRNFGPSLAYGVTTILSLRQDTNAVSVVRGSKTWGNVATGASLSNNTASSQPFVVHVDISAATQTVALIFTHSDTLGRSWMSEVPLSLAGTQTLTGKVVYLTGGKPVKGATVSFTGPVSGTALTAANGTYKASVPDGTYDVTARLAGYATTSPKTASLPRAGANVDFTMGRALLSVAPASIAVKHSEQAVTTKTVAVTNKGDLPLSIAVQNSSLGNAVSTSYYNTSSYGVATRSLQAAYAPLPWQDGFESGISSLTPSRFHKEWDDYLYPYVYHYVIDFYKGESSVVTSPAAVGQRSLYYKDPLLTGFNNGLEKRFANASQPCYISYWVRPGDVTGTSGCFSREDGWFDTSAKKWDWSPIVQITASEGGTLSANGMLTSGDKTVPFTGKAWHHIELRNLDWSARTFDYWVNGQLIKRAIGFQGYATQAMRVHIYNDTVEGESWWDELRVLEQDDVWLSQTPGRMTLAPGETSSISVTASAVDQRPGTYRARLGLISNDSLNPFVNVPVTMTVTTYPNTAPVASSQVLTLLEDEVKTIMLPVTDKENDSVIVSIMTLPKIGSLSLTPGGSPLTAAVTLPLNQKTVYYTPPQGAHGANLARFSFQSRDYRLSSFVATITLNVTDFNDTPVAVDDFLFLSSNATVSKNLLSNDYDEESDAIQIVSLSLPSKGTVENK
ncbi:MAG: S8 family serine peptidase, partial [Verrucomicrobia bacterium]|nr:S8 family serine peptidase [Verrucomicrobiota bacterium]